MATAPPNPALSGDTIDWRFNDDVQRKIVGTCLLIVCVIGGIGNSMVIVAVSLSKKLQNVTNIFVTNLAVSDLLHCVILPFMVHDLYQPLADLSPDPVLCTINGALTILFLSVSVFSHALIAATRYVIITRPRRAYQTMFTTNRVVVIIVIIWIIAFIDPLLSMAGLSPLGYNPKYGICSKDIRSVSSVILSTVRSVYTNVFSVVVVLFCYGKIFIYVRKHNQSALRRIMTSSTASESGGSRKADPDEGGKANDIASTKFESKEKDNDICVNANDTARIKHTEGLDTNVHYCTVNDGITASIKDTQTISFDDDKQTNVDLTLRRTTSANDMQREVMTPVANTMIQNVNRVVNTRNPMNNTIQSMEVEMDDNVRSNFKTALSSGEELTSAANDKSYSCMERIEEVDENQNFRGKNWRWRSHKSSERPSKERKEIDITKKLFIVVCVFFACMAPYLFFVSIKGLERLLPYAALLQASSSCLNPIIYALSHPHFQQVFTLMVSCQLSKIPKKTGWLTWVFKRKIDTQRKGVI